MVDLIITGASRGIGRALCLALADGGPPRRRLLLSARDAERLAGVAAAVRERGGEAAIVPGDLGSLAGARALGARLLEVVSPGATLVHNAGLWPARRILNEDELETSFVVNHLGPLTLQARLLAEGHLARILVVSAGLIEKGRFDAARTPVGADFSGVRTYCTTKLCFAVAMRAVARAHPELDVAVLHPGVVRTDLGARPGPIGWLLSLVKRTWEAPEVCAARLAAMLTAPRWSASGEAHWFVETEERPWPAAASDPDTARAIDIVTRQHVREPPAG